MSAELDAVILAQKTSDAVYDLFVNQIGSTMEQAEIASRDPSVMKNFSLSAGGGVLRFQTKPVMHSDGGAPVKNFLKVNRLDFLLPPETPDPVKALEIPPDVLAAAKAGNLTKKSELFTLVHGAKPKSAEAESLATVAALIAGETLREPPLDNQLPPVDDRTRRAARAADTAHANNPWGAAAWSVTKQGELVKAIGLEAAAGIARAAGSHIGATKPAKVIA